MSHSDRRLVWLEPLDQFPDLACAWGTESDAPGLLAAGGDLRPDRLLHAYKQGIYPWFSEGQPILWWTPDPRMVLRSNEFKLHRSLRKVISRFQSTSGCEVRFDTVFEQVMEACANNGHRAQPGTWILPQMIDAYTELHRLGYAHSVETWVDGQLVGGLYLVAIGHAVFGESMFSVASNASKIALAALVTFCRANAVQVIDCQQTTAHLRSLGAVEIKRSQFMHHVQSASLRANLDWHFEPGHWGHLQMTSKVCA